MKRVQKTRVVIDGEDAGNITLACSLSRDPGSVDSVDLRLAIDSLDIDADGTLVINIETGA